MESLSVQRCGVSPAMASLWWSLSTCSPIGKKGRKRVLPGVLLPKPPTQVPWCRFTHAEPLLMADGLPDPHLRHGGAGRTGGQGWCISPALPTLLGPLPSQMWSPQSSSGASRPCGCSHGPFLAAVTPGGSDHLWGLGRSHWGPPLRHQDLRLQLCGALSLGGVDAAGSSGSQVLLLHRCGLTWPPKGHTLPTHFPGQSPNIRNRFLVCVSLRNRGSSPRVRVVGGRGQGRLTAEREGLRFSGPHPRRSGVTPQGCRPAPDPQHSWVGPDPITKTGHLLRVSARMCACVRAPVWPRIHRLPC